MLARFISPRITMLSATRFAMVGARKNMMVAGQMNVSTLGDTMKGKESVEEQRYVRIQEEEWKNKLRSLRAAETHGVENENEEELNAVSSMMKEIADKLAETNDSISVEGLEQLAKWKMQ